MPQFATPTLNIPVRKVKGLIKLFGGIAAPWYFTQVAVVEGTPMKLDTAQDRMIPAVAAGGADVIGLAMQVTYDDSAYGQLQGYHFVNDTRQRLDGSPIGLLTGAGFALTNNFKGAVAWGNQAYLDITGAGTTATGKMSAAVNATSKIPVVFEGSGTDGDRMVRIRFNFPLA